MSRLTALDKALLAFNGSVTSPRRNEQWDRLATRGYISKRRCEGGLLGGLGYHAHYELSDEGRDECRRLVLVHHAEIVDGALACPKQAALIEKAKAEAREPDFRRDRCECGYCRAAWSMSWATKYILLGGKLGVEGAEQLVEKLGRLPL